ncbi:WS/DGAT/MGAT family O-acyltransferase [Yinghuangia soli]|uniref:Diacylglycerol O-acyltransferase n=1 Tax=Yinghuangia soli TaxID=2908204 RepID=A0AA41PX26_9ACTN|nr:wax ester/triacylglycerol synthase family O-acyltransferase [Yinghuangia soli]MCF2527483.1 wax ester/triacylglycerol synthase family O-acyltransferase [Yinghuangia soli]
MKLSGLDSAFLALESETWPMHVVCLTVVDASDTGGRIDHEAFKETLAKRLPRLPLLSRKLVQSPWGLSRPHWVPDPDFDFRDHVHRATVARPGGRRELADLAAQIYRNRLDRDRPLWEWWVVEGLENDRIAHMWKVHHACIDGRAGASMQEVFFDADPVGGISRELVPLPMPDEEDPLPEGFARVAEMAKSVAGTPVRLVGQLGSTAQGVVSAAMTGRLSQAMPLNMPRTRFNAPVGKERSYGFCTVSLSDVKTVKNAFGVKVNDVVLAIVGGAMREQLDSFGETPDKQLVGTVPVDATKGDTRSSGNLITGMLVGLSTDIADPAERLLCIHENALASKAVQGALGNDLLTNLADTPPPVLLSLGGDVFRAAKIATHLPPVCNAVISNVPGPRKTLYSQGQKVEAFHSMGIVADGFGLFVGGMSYDDQIDIGVLADRETLPDPFALADSIVDQLNVLLKAAHEFGLPAGSVPQPDPETQAETEAEAVVPAEDPVEVPAGQPVEAPAETVAETPVAAAAEAPPVPAAKPAARPAAKRTPAAKPAAKTAKTAAKSTAKPAAKPAAKTAAKRAPSRGGAAKSTTTTRTAATASRKPAARKPAGPRTAAAPVPAGTTTGPAAPPADPQPQIPAQATAARVRRTPAARGPAPATAPTVPAATPAAEDNAVPASTAVPTTLTAKPAAGAQEAPAAAAPVPASVAGV